MTADNQRRALRRAKGGIRRLGRDLYKTGRLVVGAVVILGSGIVPLAAIVIGGVLACDYVIRTLGGIGYAVSAVILVVMFTLGFQYLTYHSEFWSDNL